MDAVRANARRQVAWVIALMPRCCGRICPWQRVVHFGAAMPQAGDMAHDDKNPLFSERVRDQMLHQRVLVLDGVLDDDNGTLLATQLLTLAAEDPAADVALWIHSPGGSVPAMLALREIVDSFGQVIPVRKH
jgi:ClpP class serine protease